MVMALAKVCVAKLLIVDDDVHFADRVGDWLRHEGHVVEVVYDGDQGWDRGRFYKFDVIVLDWQLPGRTGLQILSDLRAN